MGWEQRGARKERKEEKDGDTWRYSDFCCCQRSSSSIQGICCHWSSIHLSPQWALRSWTAAPEAAKSPPSPEQLCLRKQLCFQQTHLARADGHKNPEDSQDSSRLTAAFVSLQRKELAALEYSLLKKGSTAPVGHGHSAGPGLVKGSARTQEGSVWSARYPKHTLSSQKN